jgi:hypothetical protein
VSIWIIVTISDHLRPNKKRAIIAEFIFHNTYQDKDPAT